MKLLKKCTIIIITFCLVFLNGCHDSNPIENLAIITGFGYDIEKENKSKFVTAIEFLKIEKKDEASSECFVGKGDSIYNSVENYKAKQGKPFSYGSELVYIISEERAKSDIKDIAVDLLSYPNVNINAQTLICKDTCEEYFSLKSNSGSASEKLADIIKFENQEYFFSNQYTVNDFLCMYYQQGRNLYLPYIEIIEDNFELTGVAIFKNNKFYKKVPIEEAKLINLLRESGGNGIVTIPSNNFFEFSEIEGENKLDVKVSTENKNLRYDIFVNISGDLRIDTLHDTEFTKEQISKIEKEYENKLKKELDTEVQKVQNVYGTDCLDIGKYAIAKYGRDSGYDNDKYFSNAKINTDVKINIKSTGRIQKNPVGN